MTPPESATNDSSIALIGLAVIVGFGLLLGSLLLIGAQSPRAQIANCLAHSAPLTQVSGPLRRASQDYYLVTEGKWHLLHTRCSGKVRQACLAATANAEDWLESHLGETASATLCTNGVIDYTVAARQFHR